MKITINGTSHIISGPGAMLYEDIIKLAGERPGASVTYSGPRNGDSQRSGILCRGENVVIEDGMRFSAVMTGSA